MSKKQIIGLWPLLGSNPTLYTKKAADVIKDKKTGKQYVRGEIVLFKESQPPPMLAEEQEHFQFIYAHEGLKEPKTVDYAKEIFVSTLFKK